MVKIESIRVLGIDSDDLTHDLLTVKQGAAYYGCSIENIHKMIQASKLDCFIDQDNTNIRYVLKSQVLEMICKIGHQQLQIFLLYQWLSLIHI